MQRASAAKEGAPPPMRLPPMRLSSPHVDLQTAAAAVAVAVAAAAAAAAAALAAAAVAAAAVAVAVPTGLVGSAGTGLVVAGGCISWCLR